MIFVQIGPRRADFRPCQNFHLRTCAHVHMSTCAHVRMGIGGHVQTGTWTAWNLPGLPVTVSARGQPGVTEPIRVPGRDWAMLQDLSEAVQKYPPDLRLPGGVFGQLLGPATK